MIWGLSQFLSVHIDSLEHHSNTIADAVKKVIKVGKVSLERLWGLGSRQDFLGNLSWGVLSLQVPRASALLFPQSCQGCSFPFSWLFHPLDLLCLLVPICYSLFPAPSIGSLIGHLNGELAASRLRGDGGAEGDSWQDEAPVSLLHTWKPILICHSPAVICASTWSSLFPPRHPSPVFNLHFPSHSCSASHPRPGHSRARTVALALKRQEWTGPCSSKPGRLLASLLHCLLFLAFSPSLDSISITLPCLHGLSFFPHGCCRWWL